MNKDKELNLWKARISAGKKEFKKFHDVYKQNLKFYIGDQLDAIPKSLSNIIAINLIFVHIQRQLPALLMATPYFNVSPKKENIRTDPIVVEKTLNYAYKEWKYKYPLRLAAVDAFLGLGIIKTIYNAKIVDHPLKGQPVTMNNMPILNNNGNVMTYPDEYVESESFKIKRVNPLNFIIDPECENDYESAKWVAQKLILSYEDIKKDKKYKNTEDLVGTDDTEYMPDIPIDSENTTEFKKCTLWEIYDIEENEIKVFVETYDKWLRHEPLPDGIERHPYCILKFYELPNKVVPLTEIGSLRGVQTEYNIARSQILSAAKKSFRKYLTEDGVFEDEELEKLLEPYDGLVVKANPDKMTKFIALPDTPINPTVLENFRQIQQDFWNLAGSAEYERGMVERRKTATEFSGIKEYKSIVRYDKASMVQDFVSDIMKKIIQLIQANLSKELSFKVAGAEGEKWINIKDKAEIAGEFDIDVFIDAEQPKTPDTEKSKLVSLMQVLTPLMQWPPLQQILTVDPNTKMDVTEFIREIVRTFGLRDKNIMKT